MKLFQDIIGIYGFVMMVVAVILVSVSNTSVNIGMGAVVGILAYTTVLMSRILDKD